MEIQLKDTQGNYRYPILSEDDAANTIRLKKSLGGASLYPSVEGIDGNCILKTMGGNAYPVVLDTPIEPAWRPTAVAVELIGNGTPIYQGLAIADGYCIYFNDSSSLYIIKTLPDFTAVKQASLQPADTNRHTNTLNFGTLRYDDGDTYPLLYGSGNLNSKNTDSQLQQTIDVYRVTVTEGVWNVVPVQVIDFSAIDTYGDVAFYGEYMVIKHGGNVKVCKCPPIKDAGGNILSTYTMLSTDVMYEYTLTDVYQYAQGYTIVGRYLINLSMSSGAWNYITIMDMLTGRQLANFSLNAAGVTAECEQIAYDGSMDKFYLFLRNGSRYYVNFTPSMPSEQLNSED